MLYVLNERRHETRNLQKDLFLGHLQPGVGKNSKDLAILILEFDDVKVKTTYLFRAAPVSWPCQSNELHELFVWSLCYRV